MANIKYNIEKLKRILNDLYEITGLNIALLDTEYHGLYSTGKTPAFCTEIQNSPDGLSKCLFSDLDMIKKCEQKKKLVTHKCHAGITDSVMPILKDSAIVGYIMIGQTRQHNDLSEIYEKNEWLGYDKNKLEKNYKKLTFFSEAQLRSLGDLITHIIFENAIELENSFASQVSAYINSNIHRSISVKELCTVMYMSKNVLYENFHKYFECSVNDYVISRRIKHAETLLCETDENTTHISELVGISNYAYFCKLFKKRTGLTPAQYRKKHKV